LFLLAGNMILISYQFFMFDFLSCEAAF